MKMFGMQPIRINKPNEGPRLPLKPKDLFVVIAIAISNYMCYACYDLKCSIDNDNLQLFGLFKMFNTYFQGDSNACEI